MADELTLRVSISFTGTHDTVSKAEGPVTVDVTGDNPLTTVQDVGITEEALLLGDAGVGGYCFLKNLDATNFVEVRPATGVADLIRLEPSDVALFRITDDAAPYVIADTAVCRLEVAVIPA